MWVYYHNKGIEMLHLPEILNNKMVRDTVPVFLNNRKPTIVSYIWSDM